MIEPKKKAYSPPLGDDDDAGIFNDEIDDLREEDEPYDYDFNFNDDD